MSPVILMAYALKQTKLITRPDAITTGGVGSRGGGINPYINEIASSSSYGLELDKQIRLLVYREAISKRKQDVLEMQQNYRRKKNK